MKNRDKLNKEIITKSNDELAHILSNSPCCYCYYNGDCAGVTCDIGVKKCLETPCRENPLAENNPPADEPQEAIPTEVRVDLRKVAKEIVSECKEHYPNDCEDCRYGDSIGLCCFKDRPTTWGLEIADKGTQPDNVNHPAHYTFGNIEVIDFIEDKELGFHLGNAVKYISRAGRKNPDNTIEDLRKAVWYINRQIDRLECE